MNEISYVVVFPTIFSKNKMSQLVLNIKKILKIKNQQFKSVKRMSVKKEKKEPIHEPTRPLLKGGRRG